jgi:methylmalonyl-CoA mutase N-terminal domain/subunit
MKSEVSHKRQLAISVAKGKRVVLQQVLANYVVRWREHAFRQGVDPDKPPRTIYNDIITEIISNLNDEIDVLEGNVIEVKQ